MAWANTAGQRPALVVMGATSAHRVSGIHVLHVSPENGSAQRDDQLLAAASTTPYRDPGFVHGRCRLAQSGTIRPMFAHSSMRRPLSPVLAAAVTASALGLALFTTVISATSAAAHAELVKITPERNARLTNAPTEVVLEFSEPVSASFATVLVTTASGAIVTKGRPAVVGARITQALNPRLDAGAYRVAFRVVSADGHPVTGGSGFTLLLASSASPSTSAPSASPPAKRSPVAPDLTPAQSPRASPDGGLRRLAVVIAGAVGLLIVGAGLLTWLRKRP
jgi:methionine-rich copper-binding protein CopC